jgi:hypothetical protein
MLHPLVDQLRFARSEFERGLASVTDPEAQQRFGNLNCISWIVGHLAWQEQRYWVQRAQGKILLPLLNELLAYGKPAWTPPAAEMWAAWRTITQAADVWLETVTGEQLQALLPKSSYSAGNFLLRTIDHYWYHLGEGMAIRQMLGHTGLPDFVGDIDGQAPYRPEGRPSGRTVTKDQFLTQVRETYSDLSRLLNQAGPSRLLELIPGSSWTLKDVIAHLTWHEREMLGMIQRRNVDGSDLWLMPTDERNQVIYVQYRETPAEQVLSDSRQVHQDLVQALERLEEEALVDPARFGNMPSDWRPWDILAGNTYAHYAEHILSVQNWLEKTPGL